MGTSSLVSEAKPSQRHFSGVATGTVRKGIALLASATLLVGLFFATTPALASAPIAYHTLSKGSRGVDVRALQYLLKHHGQPLAVDGAFGPNTESAVKSFQTSKGLAADGVVGPATWGKLIVTTSKGASGHRVAAVTTLLNKWDRAGVTSTFDSTVKARVEAFQSHMGISVDGIVGPTTWKHLVFHYEQPNAFTVLCKGRTGGVDDFGYATDAWGTAQTTAFLEKAGNEVYIYYFRQVAFRDLSLEHGGDISGHSSHELGMDIDIRPMSTTNYQCNISSGDPINYWDPEYSRVRTKVLFLELKAASSGLGRDLHKVTFFNDQVLIDQVTEMRKCCKKDNYTSHNEHLHVRFCTAYYPYDPRYDC